jgi:hypothetical protein
METMVDRFLTYLMAMSTATEAALTLVYIAHYDFGHPAKRFVLPPWSVPS